MGTSSAKVDRSFVMDVLNELVSTNSVNPDVGNGPGEAALSDALFDRLDAMDNLEVRRQRVTEMRSNVVAILRGSGGGRSLMLNGHMDTVGVERMTIEPFKPSLKGERLHGRGACDMKAGIAAMLGAAKSLADSKSSLRGDVILSFVVDEEHMSLGTSKLVEEYRANAAIVGEPTNMRIATAHKGFVWIEVVVRGVSAHGSVPEQGVDAIDYAAKVVTRLRELQDKLAARSHPLVGAPKIHTSTIEGGTHWSIIPDRCLLKLERRTIPGETTALVMQEIQEILTSVKQENSNFNAELRCVVDRPPLDTSPTETIIQKLQQALTELGTANATVVGVPYWTDGAILAHFASIPTCLFGPGDISVAHSRDEYVNVKDAFRASEVYTAAAQKFCA